MSALPYSALTRGDDGNLHVRRFATAAEANAASNASREYYAPAPLVPAPTRARRTEWKLSRVAQELGVSTKTIKKYLPYLRYRQPSPNITYVPGEELNLLKIHGLHGVRAMRLRTGNAIPAAN